MKFKLKTYSEKIIADIITPVSVYLKIRDKYPNSILLESSDYHANDNSFSYICFNPIASILVENHEIKTTYPDGSKLLTKIDEQVHVPDHIHAFSQQFEIDKSTSFKFINNGIFGYTAYDAVQYFEDVEITKKEGSLDIPEIYYAVYQNVIAINHFKNVAYVFAHCFDTEDNVAEIHQ